MKYFCSQCRKEYKLDEFEEFQTKAGKKMGKSKCPVCGMVLYRRLDTDYDITEIDSKIA